MGPRFTHGALLTQCGQCPLAHHAGSFESLTAQVCTENDGTDET